MSDVVKNHEIPKAMVSEIHESYLASLDETNEDKVADVERLPPPQTDGLTERANQTLADVERCGQCRSH